MEKKEQTGGLNYALLFPVFFEETTLTGAFKSDKLIPNKKRKLIKWVQNV